MWRRLGAAFLALLALNLVFWLTVNFRTFQPPSPGVLPERAYYSAITACGPFAMLPIRYMREADLACLVISGIIAALLAIALFGRRFLLLRCLGYLGLVLWWLTGFAVAAIRID